MTHTPKIRTALFAAAMTLLTVGAASAAETGSQYTGRIIDRTGTLPGHSTPFVLQIEEPTSREEALDLFAVLENEGAAAFDAQIEDLDRGWIRIGNGLAQEIAVARVVDGEQAGEEIVRVIMDRPMGLAEVAYNTRSSDYGYTVLEMSVHADGKGEGKMIAAADIELNEAGQLEIENLGVLPLELAHVEAR